MGIKRVFAKIGKFFYHVGEGFVGVFGVGPSKAFAKAALGLLKSTAGKVVLDVVKELEGSTASGDQKRASAFTRIGSELGKLGISLAKHELHLLIELAVQTVKAGAEVAIGSAVGAR